MQVFAVDSIPAIFGVTSDPLVVWSSSVMAILGLRALYALLAERLGELSQHLNKPVAVLLLFISGKVILEFLGFAISTKARMGAGCPPGSSSRCLMPPAAARSLHSTASNRACIMEWLDGQAVSKKGASDPQVALLAIVCILGVGVGRAVAHRNAAGGSGAAATAGGAGGARGRDAAAVDTLLRGGGCGGLAQRRGGDDKLV